MKCINLLILLILLSSASLAMNSDQQRFDSLSKEIRCLVCQNQNIADSNAPLAKDLRQKIYHMIQEKQSDEDIKNYLVKRYGEFILLNPRLNYKTALLWFFPIIGLIIFSYSLFRIFKIC